MSVKITGMDKLTKELESRYGKMRMQELTDQALKAGGEVFLKELKIQFENWKVDGYSIDEMTISEPHDVAGVRTITVKWRGPHKRYTIIHLNEFGTVHSPKPPGKGSVARALDASRKPYRQALKKALQGGI